MEFAGLEILECLLGVLPGIVIGLIIGKNIFKKTGSIVGSADNKIKLENEVLSDQVKQLEAKIQTLEKALDIASS